MLACLAFIAAWPWASTGQVYGLLAFAAGFALSAAFVLLVRREHPPARTPRRDGDGER